MDIKGWHHARSALRLPDIRSSYSKAIVRDHTHPYEGPIPPAGTHEVCPYWRFDFMGTRTGTLQGDPQQSHQKLYVSGQERAGTGGNNKKIAKPYEWGPPFRSGMALLTP